MSTITSNDVVDREHKYAGFIFHFAAEIPEFPQYGARYHHADGMYQYMRHGDFVWCRITNRRTGNFVYQRTVEALTDPDGRWLPQAAWVDPDSFPHDRGWYEVVIRRPDTDLEKENKMRTTIETKGTVSEMRKDISPRHIHSYDDIPDAMEIAQRALDAMRDDVFSDTESNPIMPIEEPNTGSPPLATKPEYDSTNTLGSTNDAVRARSGEIQSNEKLIAFIYLLLRDELPSGAVERIVTEICEAEPPFVFTAGWIAEYAKDLAARIEVRAMPQVEETAAAPTRAE